jgi:hypothetical protein
MPRSPEDFAGCLAAEAPKWRQIVKASGVQINSGAGPSPRSSAGGGKMQQ